MGACDHVRACEGEWYLMDVLSKSWDCHESQFFLLWPKQKIGLFPVGNPSKRRLGRPEWNFFWILFFGSSIVVALMDKSTYTCTLYHGKDQCQSWLTHCSCTACGVFLFSYILRNQANSSSPSSSVILARVDPRGFRADSWESLLPCRCFNCEIRLRFDWVMTRLVHLHTWHCHRLHTFGTKKSFWIWEKVARSGDRKQGHYLFWPFPFSFYQSYQEYTTPWGVINLYSWAYMYVVHNARSSIRSALHVGSQQSLEVDSFDTSALAMYSIQVPVLANAVVQ